MILVVDDEEPNRVLLEAILAPAGFAVATASSGAAALAAIRAGGVELVLLDVLMPQMGGIETCRRIREELGQRTLPVILVSALGDRAARIRGKDSGADDYLVKPIDATELLARVKNLSKVKAYHDLVARQREEVERELALRQEELLRAAALVTMGTLAASVGHELNNLATGLRLTTEMIQDAVAAGVPPEEEDVAALNRAVETLVVHARGLLQMAARGGARGEAPAEAGGAVRRALELLRLTGRTKHVEVTAKLPEGTVYVALAPRELEQLVLNLVANAAEGLTQSARGSKAIEVEVGLEAADKRARVVVRDNGDGVPADVLERLFAHYVTSEGGTGSGLGLAAVKRIAESAGGSVAVASSARSGTEVTVRLPLGAP